MNRPQYSVRQASIGAGLVRKFAPGRIHNEMSHSIMPAPKRLQSGRNSVRFKVIQLGARELT